MSVTVSEDGKSVTYDAYVKRGKVQLLREGLEISDPDHLYNYLQRELNSFNLIPEDIGVTSPLNKYLK